MSVINTNLQAITAARNLDQTQDLLTRSLNRLSSGSKIVNPADDPAGLAVSEKLASQNLRVQAASTNVQNAISYAQTADSYLGNMKDIVTRMSELSVLSSDVTKNSSDIGLYEQEFSALQDQLRTTIGGSAAEIGGPGGVSAPLGVFNGTTLFGSGAGPTVSIGESSGQQLSLPTLNLRTGSVLSLIQQDASGNYLLTAGDPSAVSTMSGAIQQLGVQRSSLGASESRLGMAASTLQVESQNLSATVSQIRDVDVAQESTQLAKYNILVQSGTAMLAQANQTPQAVLKLLQ